MNTEKDPCHVFLDISIDNDPPERLLFKLLVDYAPHPSRIFCALCSDEKKPLHYKGTFFHRIVKGSMAQGGGFLKHDEESTGSVKLADGDSHDSSFSIRFGANHLVKNDLAFGELVQGHDLLNKIENAGTVEGTPIVPVKIVNCGEIYLEEFELYEDSQTRIEKQAYNNQVPTRSYSGSNLQGLHPYSKINWVQESTRFNKCKNIFELSVNQTFDLRSNGGSSCIASLVSPQKLCAFEDQKILEYSGRENRMAPGTDSGTDLSVCCNCIKSQCLKRYCECFAKGHYCDKACTCKDCLNSKENELEVEAARDHVELRNPQAFGLNESGVPVPPSSAIKTVVCNCRKSSCSKNYCDCYKGLTGCTDRCGCETCKNTYGTKQDYVAACKRNLQMSLTGIDSHQYNSMHSPNVTSPTTPFQRQYFGEDASRTKPQIGEVPAQVCSNLYNPNLLPPNNLNSNNQTVHPGYSQTAYNTCNFQFHVNHDLRSQLFQVPNQVVQPDENPEFLQQPSAQKKGDPKFPTTKKGDPKFPTTKKGYSDPFSDESKKHL